MNRSHALYTVIASCMLAAPAARAQQPVPGALVDSVPVLLRSTLAVGGIPLTPPPVARPYVVPAPKPAPLSTLARINHAAQALRDSIVSVARAQLGRRYRFGGETPEHGFDCSGLVKYIVAALNVKVPRTAAQQALVGAAVPRDTSRLLPGDLLLFGRGKRISHIGIYVGEGQFIHASTAAHRVIVSKLIRPAFPTIKPWKGVRRLVRSDSVSVVAQSDSSGQ